MATITLTELQAAVRLRMNAKTTDSVLTTANITEAINDAIRTITLEHDWFWLHTSTTITTVAGTSVYAVPADFLRTISITDTVIGNHLVQFPLIDLDSIVGQGRPNIYAVEAGNIILKPIPSDVNTFLHRYVKTETPLSVGGDTPLIPKEFSEGIVHGAALTAARFIRDSQMAAEAAADYNDWLTVAQDNNRRSKEPMRVRVRRGSWV